jgi:hypothetical protein
MQEMLNLTIDDSLRQAEVGNVTLGQSFIQVLPVFPRTERSVDVRLSVNGAIILATDSVGEKH